MLTEKNLKTINREPSKKAVQTSLKMEVPKFLVVLNDSDFQSSEQISFLMNSSHSRADIVEGKIKKRVGSAIAISLQSANSDKWKDRLDPAPKVNAIYAKHPYDDKPYIGLKLFHEVVMNQKLEELFYILSNLGSKSVTWTEAESWTRDYESPGLLEPVLKDADLMWFLPYTPQWEAVVQERLNNWSKKIFVDFIYEGNL